MSLKNKDVYGGYDHVRLTLSKNVNVRIVPSNDTIDSPVGTLVKQAVSLKCARRASNELAGQWQYIRRQKYCYSFIHANFSELYVHLHSCKVRRI